MVVADATTSGVKSDRNICSSFRDIQAMENKEVLDPSSVGHELINLNLRNYC